MDPTLGTFQLQWSHLDFPWNKHNPTLILGQILIKIVLFPKRFVLLKITFVRIWKNMFPTRISIMDNAVKLPTLIWFDILSLHKYNDGFGFVYSRIKFGFWVFIPSSIFFVKIMFKFNSCGNCPCKLS